MSSIMRLVGLLLVALLLVACAPETLDSPQTPSPDSPVATDTPLPTKGDVVPPGPGVDTTGLAHVEAVEVLLLESFPLQVQVVARGNLPDGCTQIDEVTELLEGNTFRVEIRTIRPADAICTAVIVPFQQVIPLDVYGLPAGAYKVLVNGQPAAFEFSQDNILMEEPVKVGVAMVDSLELIAETASPDVITILVRGNLPDGCTTISGTSQEVEGSTIRVTLSTERPAEAMCIAVVLPYEEMIEIGLKGLAPGAYQVFVNDISLASELLVD